MNAAVGRDQVYNSAVNARSRMTLRVSKHSNQPCSVIFVNFYNFSQQSRHYVVTCQLSAQEIVNWVTTADGCVHTADVTQLDSFVASASAVCIGHYIFSAISGTHSQKRA